MNGLQRDGVKLHRDELPGRASSVGKRKESDRKILATGVREDSRSLTGRYGKEVQAFRSCIGTSTCRLWVHSGNYGGAAWGGSAESRESDYRCIWVGLESCASSDCDCAEDPTKCLSCSEAHMRCISVQGLTVPVEKTCDGVSCLPLRTRHHDRLWMFLITVMVLLDILTTV